MGFYQALSRDTVTYYGSYEGAPLVDDSFVTVAVCGK